MLFLAGVHRWKLRLAGSPWAQVAGQAQGLNRAFVSLVVERFSTHETGIAKRNIEECPEVAEFVRLKSDCW
jgi:hypothetical protein